jgi:hypothetical protein
MKQRRHRSSELLTDDKEDELPRALLLDRRHDLTKAHHDSKWHLPAAEHYDKPRIQILW